MCSYTEGKSTAPPPPPPLEISGEQRFFTGSSSPPPSRDGDHPSDPLPSQGPSCLFGLDSEPQRLWKKDWKEQATHLPLHPLPATIAVSQEVAPQWMEGREIQILCPLSEREPTLPTLLGESLNRPRPRRWQPGLLGCKKKFTGVSDRLWPPVNISDEKSEPTQITCVQRARGGPHRN